MNTTQHKQQNMKPFLSHSSKLIFLQILFTSILRCSSLLSDYETIKNCDLFTGEWVLDDVPTSPLYTESECKYLREWVKCLTNQRPDSLYQKWRWQPRDCSLPRFNAELFLQKIKGKRLLFVGDSIHMNQWQSLICMVQSIIPSEDQVLRYVTSRSAYFSIKNYNVTLEFYWAPYLVESSVDDIKSPLIGEEKSEPTLLLDSISNHGKHWIGADYLIFDTFAWWSRFPNLTFQHGRTQYREKDLNTVYEKALNTWANWINKNVDPSRTMVFFSTMSPMHIRSRDWNDPEAKNCASETTPIPKDQTQLNIGINKELFEITEKVIKNMDVSVHLLDITALSEYRKDAHPSFYGVSDQHTNVSLPVRKLDPWTYADCIHWCLPGVPDTWNEFLFAKIVYS